MHHCIVYLNPGQVQQSVDIVKPPDKTIERPRASTALRLARLFAKVILPVLILAAGFGGYRYLTLTKPDVATAPAVERVWPVEAVTIAIGTVTPTLTAYGTLDAARSVALRPLVGGEVVAIGPQLRDGAEVAAGDMLIEIDRFDYESALSEARANLDEAEARLAELEARVTLEETLLDNARSQLELGERDLARALELGDRGALSDRTVDERRLIVEQRRQQIIQRENTIAIEQARAAQQRAAIDRLRVVAARAERNLANTTLVAPFDGIISDPTVEVGRMVSANDAVATLLSSGDVEVRFTLTETDYAGLVSSGEDLLGRPAQVIWSAGGEDSAFPARIVRVAPRIDATRGGVDLIADLDRNPEALRPGAFVELRLADRTYEGVAVLPQTALYGTDTVYAIVDGRLERRDVRVVALDGGDVLVRGDLDDGDVVLTSRITEVGDGLAVDILAAR